MPEAKLIPYDWRMSVEQFVRFHVLVYTFSEGLNLSRTCIHALTLVGIRGEVALTDLCKELVERKVYLSKQSALNAMSYLYRLQLVNKEGSHRKMVSLCDKMRYSNDPLSVLVIRCVHNI